MRVIGSSGSPLSAMRDTLALTESGGLSTSYSLAAVGDMGSASKGMKALMDNTYTGKVVIFPFAHGIGLKSIRELARDLPEIAPLLLDGQYWTREAEAAFLQEPGIQLTRRTTEETQWPAPRAMKTLSPAYRLQGSLPKIGIRPAIDGRRKGVRESLEAQTMAMARAVADLLAKSIRHPCGLPVECVIADTCIGGVAEAARAAEKFRARRRRGVPHRDPVLVLRRGDHGHGSAHAQGGLGLQRHRAPGGGVPRGGARRARAEGPARVRHLRPGRAGRR